MSNKTTMILTFIVSVVVPFIQEVVDLIEALKGKASSKYCYCSTSCATSD